MLELLWSILSHLHSMLPAMKFFLVDEELGKKDDDYKRRTDKHRSWRPRQWKAPRPRRVLLVAVGAYILYLFFQNMPTDLTPTVERYHHRIPQARHDESQRSFSMPSPAVISHSAPPPRDESMAANMGDFYYDGEIEFHALRKSLLPFREPLNRHAVSRAVVFAASSLRSVSDLLPLACRMADQTVNNVHFVLMGKDNVSFEGIQHVNGIRDGDCTIHWHDSRPNYAQWSTDTRMERAVIAGLHHVELFLHPQVIITQRDLLEDAFFSKGVRKETQDTNVPCVTLPGSSSNLMWISTLDSTALRAWNDVDIEILLHAPSESSGSQIRLIKSLENADYLGLPPMLTLELPPRTDPLLLRFLETMKWPPRLSGKLTVRRRVRQENMSPAESAIRTVEAFYPRSPNTSHLLVLSPHVELAPSFYHYLLYAALNYKQSSQGKFSPKLFGISLELPFLTLTDNEPFTPPSQKSTGRGAESKPALPHFLWQAPNSNAALYFGDKWTGFHSFLSNRLTVQEATTGVASHEKVVSRKYPAFMEFLLEFIRAKGYYMLYPSFPSRESYTLATVHKELYHAPEEFLQGRSSKTLETPVDSIAELSGPLTADFKKNLESSEAPLSQESTIMSLLHQFVAGFPELNSMPLLSYRGDRLSSEMHRQDTEEYARKFRVRYGGCHDGFELEKASELFCMNE